MKRFLVFPVVLGIYGALFLTFCWAEFILAQYPIWGVAFVGPSFWTALENILVPNAIFGLTIGIVAGVGFAFWDRVRNSHRSTPAKQISANVCWCFFYASLIIALNCLLSNSLLFFNTKLIQYPGGAPHLYLNWLIRFVGLGAVILNLTAIIWAAIRSILTDDVLTPRVLRDKLRRSSRLS